MIRVIDNRRHRPARSPSPVLPEDPGVEEEPANGTEPAAKRKRNEEDGENDDDGAHKGSKKLKFEISKNRSKKLRTLITEGVKKSEVKDISNFYDPSFKSKKFGLLVPSLDDSVYQRLNKIKRTSASKGTVDVNEKAAFAIHQKLLEVARPLLFLYSEELEDIQHDAVKDALSLWGNVFYELTQYRRRNILKQTNPSFKYLINRPENFAPSEFKDLFGRSFIKNMVKYSKEEAELSTASRIDGNNFHKNSRGQQHHGGNFQNNRYNNQSFRGNFRNNNRYALSIPSFLEIGGRIMHFANNWALITEDPWILTTVAEGLRLEFTSEPVQYIEPKTLVFGSVQESICDREIGDLIEKRAIEAVNTTGFVSSLFVIPKKSGGYRPIINLKPLNEFIVYRHFKMENLVALSHLIKQGDWMAKFDLKDAYLTVPIHQEHRHFLQFKWRGTVYQFNSLPFGLKSAPWAFTNLLKPVVACLRERGIRLVIYLDDVIVLNSSREGLINDLMIARTLFESLPLWALCLTWRSPS